MGGFDVRGVRRIGGGLAVLLLVPSIAVAKPTVSLTLPAASARAPVRYSYTSSNVPSAAKLVIQRQVGTAKQFRTVATLARARGSGTLPALDLGRYKLRIAAIERRRVKRRLRAVLLVQRQKTLTVFGTVTFSILFKQEERTFTTPTRSFSYIFTEGNVREVTNMLTIDSKVNTCRSVHVDWVSHNHYREREREPETGVVSVIQESRDPVTGSADQDEIGAVDAVVTPGRSWGVNVSSGGLNYLDFYVNGTASCYSRSLT